MASCASTRQARRPRHRHGACGHPAWRCHGAAPARQRWCGQAREAWPHTRAGGMSGVCAIRARPPAARAVACPPNCASASRTQSYPDDRRTSRCAVV